MTPELRARLRDAAGKATPGDWHVSRSGRHVKANIGAPWICEADCGEKLWRENMAFIALAQPRNTLSLLDALDAAEKREPQPMSDTLNLDEIEALAKAATPGPWVVDGDFLRTLDPIEVEYERTSIADLRYFHMPLDHDNAAYMAATNPTAVLSLITTIRTLTARVAELEGVLEPFANMAGRIDPRLEGRGNHYVSGMISDAWLLSSDFQRAARALAAKLGGA